jgi:phage tail sheath gpL-like
MEADIPGIVFDLGGLKFTAGALDPDITPALSKIGPVWETFILDCFDYKKTSRLDIYQEFGEGRWSVLEKKPLLVCHGCTDSLEDRTTITDLRKMDKINFLIVSPGSRELPFVIGAKGLINDIMTTVNKNPAQGYKGLLTSLHRGDDSAQENYARRTASVNKGSSTCIPNGSVAELNDIITFWHPESEGSFPSFRYVCDIVKLQNIVFNVKLIMEADAMKGAPLVTDDTVITNPAAVAPKTIKASFYNLADSLARNAIMVTPDFTKKTMSVKIDGANPKRVNVAFPVKISGNVEISSTDVYFGFYLGGE